MLVRICFKSTTLKYCSPFNGQPSTGKESFSVVLLKKIRTNMDYTNTMNSFEEKVLNVYVIRFHVQVYTYHTTMGIYENTYAVWYM